MSAPQRRLLQSLRRTIRKIVPRAEETISYSIPAFRLDGKIVAGFAARTKGCSYFPFSGSTLATVAAGLRGYDGTKSAVHFDADHPLKPALVRKLLKARIAESR